MTALTSPLTQPLADLKEWTSYLRAAEIPVLGQTALALESLRCHEDDISASQLGQTICADPLMTLKVLVFASGKRASRTITDAETVTANLVMMGISPFFHAFGRQPSAEDLLAGEPRALAGLRDTLTRADRSADFALAFAVHRQDRDAEVIQQAAMLHDFAEMLLWCHAPVLAMQIQDAQSEDSTLRSSIIQRQVLNVELAQLQQSLMKAWALPELLVRISDDAHANSDNVKNVLLAARLARHTANGWNNAALRDDLADIAELLNFSQDAAWRFIEQIEPADLSEPASCINSQD